MKIADFQIYILIFLLVLIIPSIYTKIQNSRKNPISDIVRIKYLINQIKHDCFYSNDMYYFAIEDCESLEVGDIVELSGSIDQKSDNSIFSKKKLIISDKIIFRPEKVSFYYWYAILAKAIGVLRFIIYQTVVNLMPYPHSGLVLSMVFGQSESLDRNTQLLFADSGTTHLQAISGYNFAVITAGIYQAGRRYAGKRFLATLMFVAALAFTAIVGLQPSVIRAVLTLITVLFVKFFLNKQHNPHFYLGIVLVLMLVVQPNWLFSLGFQLSALATIGILYFGPLVEYLCIKKAQPIYLSLQKRSWLLSIYEEVGYAVSAAISAQVLTMPLLLWQFNETSVGTLIITVLCSTLLNIIVGLTFWAILVCIGLSYLPIQPLLFTWMLILFYAPIEIFLFSLKVVANQTLLRFTVPKFSFVVVIFIYLLIAIVYLALVKKVRCKKNKQGLLIV